ncbi:unnamed protein product [Closterium sp. NIES-53]
MAGTPPLLSPDAPTEIAADAGAAATAAVTPPLLSLDADRDCCCCGRDSSSTLSRCSGCIGGCCWCYCAVVNGWVGLRAVGNGVGQSDGARSGLVRWNAVECGSGECGRGSVRPDAVGSDGGQFSAVGSDEERSRAAGEKTWTLSTGVTRARAAAVDASSCRC